MLFSLIPPIRNKIHKLPLPTQSLFLKFVPCEFYACKIPNLCTLWTPFLLLSQMEQYAVWNFLSSCKLWNDPNNSISSVRPSGIQTAHDLLRILLSRLPLLTRERKFHKKLRPICWFMSSFPSVLDWILTLFMLGSRARTHLLVKKWTGQWIRSIKISCRLLTWLQGQNI